MKSKFLQKKKSPAPHEKERPGMLKRLEFHCSSHGILTPPPKSEGNARVRRRHDCKCICHHGGVAMHFVPCCDGKLGFPKRRRPSAKRSGEKRRKKSK